MKIETEVHGSQSTSLRTNNALALPTFSCAMACPTAASSCALVSANSNLVACERHDFATVRVWRPPFTNLSSSPGSLGAVEASTCVSQRVQRSTTLRDAALRPVASTARKQSLACCSMKTTLKAMASEEALLASSSRYDPPSTNSSNGDHGNGEALRTTRALCMQGTKETPDHTKTSGVRFLALPMPTPFPFLPTSPLPELDL